MGSVTIPAGFRAARFAKRFSMAQRLGWAVEGDQIVMPNVSDVDLLAELAAHDNLAAYKADRIDEFRRMAKRILREKWDTDERVDILTEVAYKNKTGTDLGIVTQQTISDYVADIQAVKTAAVAAAQAVNAASTPAEIAAVEPDWPEI